MSTIVSRYQIKDTKTYMGAKTTLLASDQTTCLRECGAVKLIPHNTRSLQLGNHVLLGVCALGSLGVTGLDSPFPVFSYLPSFDCVIRCVFGFSFAVAGLLSLSIDYPFPCCLGVGRLLYFACLGCCCRNRDWGGAAY